MKTEVVIYGHNDLDQLGCMLNIEFALPSTSKKFFHTNYKDIQEVSYEVEDFLNQHQPKLLMITDISFADNKSALIGIVELANRLGIRVIFLDHHVYPDGFFDEFDFTYVHDITRSATQITHDFFKIDNPALNALTRLIDTFDIWQPTRPEFKDALMLNEYFWEEIYTYNKSLESVLDIIVNNNFKLPKDFKEKTINIKRASEVAIQGARNKGLIHCDGFTTIAFIDRYFNDILYDEFNNKGMEVVLIANSYGIIRIRFSTMGNMTQSTKENIKADLGCVNRGHLNAFPMVIKNPSFTKIMEQIKLITEVINKHKGK